MKRIIAIVRTEKLEPLKEALFNANVSGMTITQVMGCGNQHGWSEYYRGTEVLLNMVPKVRFELVVNDDRTQEIVDLICETARTGEVGDGKVFVSAVEEVVRIRTGASAGHPRSRTRDQTRKGPSTFRRMGPPAHATCEAKAMTPDPPWRRSSSSRHHRS